MAAPDQGKGNGCGYSRAQISNYDPETQVRFGLLLLLCRRPLSQIRLHNKDAKVTKTKRGPLAVSAKRNRLPIVGSLKNWCCLLHSDAG